MSKIRWMTLIAVAALLAAACSGTGSTATVKQTPAPVAEAPETPSDDMGGTTGSTASSGATGSTETMQAPPATGNDAQLRAAISAAQQWIAFVDQGQYAESWSASGQLFQANMQQQQWVQALTGARTPLGTVVSREVAGSEIRTELPGAPAGQYALVSVATNFQNKPDIIETVTMIDESGTWKVVGYSANPRATLEQQQQQQTQPTPTPTPPPQI